MKKIFISKIEVKNHEVLKDTLINVLRNEKKHIIITGKNGSGKTAMLNSIDIFLSSLKIKEYDNVVNLNKNIDECNRELAFIRNEGILTENSKNKISKLKNKIDYYSKKQKEFCNGVDISIMNDEELQGKYDIGELVYGYYKSRRSIDIEKNNEKVNNFIEYLHQLKDREEEAIAIEDEEELFIIRNWINMFKEFLKSIFLDKDLKFYYDKNLREYVIKESNGKISTLYELSDGHSAILKLFIELMVITEKHDENNYIIEGIILIDEIEKNIHPNLQEKIFSLLDECFPNIQFIITTMSHYIIDSAKNCLICDLDKII